MLSRVTANNLAHPFCPVNLEVNTQLPLLPDSVIHHKTSLSKCNKMIVSYGKGREKRYGVSSASKLLPVSLFTKKYEYIKRCLNLVVGLTDCEVEAVMRLLRIETYYGVAYPKASQITGELEQPPPEPFVPYPGYIPPKRHYWGTSRATFWRAIRRLKELGLVTVVNRYVLREHAQISNLYKLDKLILLIAKYLTEHIAHVWPEWLKPYLHLPWPQVWAAFSAGGDASCPGGIYPLSQ